MPINSPVPPVNDAVHAAFTDPTTGNPNTVWQYYKLIGVQATPVDGPPPATRDARRSQLLLYGQYHGRDQSDPAEFHWFESPQSLADQALGKLTNVYVNGAPGSPSRWAAAKVVTASRGNPAGI